MAPKWFLKLKIFVFIAQSLGLFLAYKYLQINGEKIIL